MKKFYSLVPWLKNEAAHFLPYTKSVEDAVQKNGWEHVAIIPKGAIIKKIPERWQEQLAQVAYGNCSIWIRPLRVVKNVFSYCKFFRKVEPGSIVFLDYHRLTDFVGIFIALLVIRPKIAFWLLHRFGPSELGPIAKIYRFLQSPIRKIYGNDFVLLTDSELLQKSQEKFFHQKVHLLPIPHTALSQELPRFLRQSREGLTLWWAGGSVRPAKGLLNIQMLALRLQRSQEKIKLVVSMVAQQYLPPEEEKILYIACNLPRREYDFWMQNVDIVLLPYLAEDYGSRTSGIFVEAITAGAIPVTTEGTWMAHELKKFAVTELIVDWTSPKILETLREIKENRELPQKLEKMREAYRAYHSLESFATQLQKVSDF